MGEADYGIRGSSRDGTRECESRTTADAAVSGLVKVNE